MRLPVQMLADGNPRHTRDLKDALLAAGVALNGKDKVLQVSAILSRERSKFKGDRSVGWTLVKPATKGEGPGASTPGPSIAATAA